MGVIFRLILFIFFAILFRQSISDHYCIKFEQGCTKRCHCRTDNEGLCDAETGRCNQTCNPGWMGKSCQYSNIAYNKNSTPPGMTDGDISSCKSGQVFKVDLLKSYPISSFAVITKNGSSSLKAYVKMSPSESSNLTNACTGLTTINSSRAELICTHTIFGQYLELIFRENVLVCEIGIHGGRNIALWQHAEQSDTYKDYFASKAVDGETGNNDFGTGYCSHSGTQDFGGKAVKSFWIVYFERLLISRLKIYFRTDNFHLNRVNNFNLQIMDSDVITYNYTQEDDPTANEDFIFKNPIFGSSVKIMLPRYQNVENNLQLCEVQVFACRLSSDGGEHCNNSCPINCKLDDDNYNCENFSCPVNKCKEPWKGHYCTQKECSISDVNNMHLTSMSTNKAPYLTGATLKTSCIEGYTQQGSGLIKCDGDGKWNSNTSCTENKCILPNKTASNLNFTVTDTTLKFNTAIEFTCDEGYTLIGPKSIQCQLDGKWDHTWNNVTPKCDENKCILPNKTASNLNFTVTDTTLKFNTAIEFTCDEGYTLIGPKSIQCQLDGKWDHTWNNVTPKCDENKCILPNKTASNLNFTVSDTTLKFDTAIEFTCDEGYKLIGPKLIQCRLDGKWNHTWNNVTPKCDANRCRFPKDIDPHLNITNFKSSVLFGAVFALSCMTGHLSGPSEIKCNPDGKWNVILNSSSPVCIIETDQSLQQNPFIPIVGSSIGAAVAVITASVIVVLFMRRRRITKKARNKPYDEIKEDEQNMYCNIRTKENSASETTFSANNDKANEQNTYYAFLPKENVSKTAIDVDKFKDYVEENKGHEGAIKLQFSNFVSGLKLPATVALSEQNRMKNKYKNICAYDDTRVILKHKNAQSKSDYINACYINGYESVKRYVASQGPIKGTEEDFLEMIFQLGSDKIVILTNLIEEGRKKCEQYWPETGEIQFGDMKVRLKSIDRYADFTIRNLSISQGDSVWKDVRQFHFTSWPDKGVPKYASSLVHFRSKVLAAPTKGKGPLVVHCSAGVGRTGTFIALDYLVSQASTVGQVDVFACVETLRRQRVNMVQTSAMNSTSDTDREDLEEQYLFLHFALEEAIICKASATAAAEFPKVYSSLQQKIPRKNIRGIDEEFETLNDTSPLLQEEDFISGKADENKMKNRYSNIIPVESHRIYLYTHVKGRNDYINAVMLPGYRESKAFIVTQMPLEDTVIDFCRLVYENDVSSIVMLNEITKETILGQYWPNNLEEIKFGNFTVEKTKEENLENVVIIHLRMQYENQEPRTIKQFQVKFWPDTEQKPRSAEDLIAVMEYVHIWQRNTGNNPVIVHCLKGCDKSGLYCVIEVTIERLKIEQDVGIQQIIKQMRSRRPQIIPNIEQYEFCHEAVLEYLQQFETYSNFQ